MKDKEFNLNKVYQGGKAMGNREMMTALAFAIYELNKCSMSWNDATILECSKTMEVCKSIVKHDDSYLNLYDSLPKDSITAHLEKIKKREQAKAKSSKTEDAQKGLVTGMKTHEDLRIVLAQLVSGEKSEAPNPSMDAQCHAITEALRALNWETFEIGTFFLRAN